MTFDEFSKEVAKVCEVEDLPKSFALDNVDSLARAEIIVLAEESFKISLTNQEILSLSTYGDLLELIEKKGMKND